MHVQLTLPNRTFGFEMDYDPQSIADVSTRRSIEMYGCCEPEVVHLMSRVLREGDIVIDVGANVGFFTLVMSHLVGRTGTVLAFEPGLNNIPKLDINLRANRVDNVTIQLAPLWSVVEPVTFYLSQDSGANALVATPGSLSSIKMQADVLDSFAEKQPRLIKIDVEGAEEHVLRGAEKMLLRGVPYITCELNQKALARFDCSQDSLRKFMWESNYEMFLLTGNGSIPPLIPPGTQLVSERENLNVLFSSVLDVSLAWPEVFVQ